MGTAPPLTQEEERMFERYYLVGFWVGTLIYGAYFFLFVMAMRVTIRRAHASKVFMVGTVAMFILITFQNFTSLYTMVCAYGTDTAPLVFIRDLTKWDAYSFIVILGLITWVGDAMVIYRCFLIWDKRYSIITFPIFLVIASVGTTAVNFYWFSDSFSIPWTIMDPLLKITYPINFVQNAFTTSLITYKIYKQHRLSASVRSEFTQGLALHSHNGLDLITVVRILIESAALYTFMMAILIVMFYMDYHPSQTIVQHAFAPIAGVAFVMISVRTHIAEISTSHDAHAFSDPRSEPADSRSLWPTWLAGEEDEALHESHVSANTINNSPGSPCTLQGDLEMGNIHSNDSAGQKGRVVSLPAPQTDGLVFATSPMTAEFREIELIGRMGVASKERV